MRKFTLFLLLILCSLYGYSQGNTFDNPIVITSFPYTTTDNTSNYGDDYGYTSNLCNGNYLGGDDVVYAFTTTEVATFSFSLTNLDGEWSGIYILDGAITNTETPNCIAFAGNGYDDDREITVTLQAGVTYYIVISTYPDPQSIGYTLGVTQLSCVMPIATAEVSTADCTTQEFYVNVNVSTIGTATTVTDGTTDWAITAGDNQIGPLTIGNITELSIHGDNTADCDFDLGSFSYYCPPTNDECSNATELVINTTVECTNTTPGTISGATASSQDNEGIAGTPNNDVWFYFTASATAHRVAITNKQLQPGGNSSTDLVLAVYDATNGCDNLSLINYSDTPESINLTNLTIGNTYYVRVYSYGTSVQNNTFDMCVITFADNNTCAGAETINVGAEDACNTFIFNNTDAYSSGTVGSCESYVGNEVDLFYSFTTNNAYGIKLDVLSGDAADIEIAIYEGCNGNQVFCQSGLEDVDNYINTLQPNTDYILQIWTESYNLDTYELCISDLPACPTPTDLDVVSTTYNSATLEWTEVGVSSNWDIEYGVEGFTPQGIPLVNDIDTNPYVLEGLEANTSYDFYVRADCSFDNTTGSNWAGPYTFTTTVAPPVNDDCSGAITLTVNNTLECTTTYSGNNNAATASVLGDEDDLVGTPNNDVWYTFVATSQNHLITLSNVVNLDDDYGTDMVMALYEGTDCNTLTHIGDSDPNSFFVGQLTVGNTYYLRIYSYYTSTQNNSFDICIATPVVTAPTNDDCDNATELTVNPTIDCNVTTSGTTNGATPSFSADDYTNVTGTPNTDVWFYFVATSNTHIVSLSNIVNATTGDNIDSSLDMGMAFYSTTNGCDNLALIDSSDPNTYTINNLTIGDTYYVRVYGWYAYIQYNTFDICVSTITTPDNDDCSGAFDITVEDNVSSLSDATQTPGTIEFATNSGIPSVTGTANDDVWYSFVATSSIINLDITDNFDGVVEVFSGDCDNLTSIQADDYSGPNSNPRIHRTDYIVGETYYFRVYYYYSSTATNSTFTIALYTPEDLATDNFETNNFTYYPNPVNNNVLNLTAANAIDNISVYNLVGQQVLTLAPKANNCAINMSNLQAGAYFVNVTIGDSSKTIKIIKE